MDPNYKVIVTWSSGFKHSFETFLTASTKDHLCQHYATLSHVVDVQYVQLNKSVV
jgi:hypothetical protein